MSSAHQQNRAWAGALIVASVMLIVITCAIAADANYRRLSAVGIRTTIIGNVVSDDARWADSFMPDSTVDTHFPPTSRRPCLALADGWPTRAAFVMAVVTPPERAVAASFTAVPRSLAAAASPALGGALFAAGWLTAPLAACGILKIDYDLAIWRAFRRISHGNS